jgi:hypothetical protein
LAGDGRAGSHVERLGRVPFIAQRASTAAVATCSRRAVSSGEFRRRNRVPREWHAGCFPSAGRKGACAMKDLLFVAISVAFFAVTWLYARSFEHL